MTVSAMRYMYTYNMKYTCTAFVVHDADIRIVSEHVTTTKSVSFNFRFVLPVSVRPEVPSSYNGRLTSHIRDWVCSHQGEQE